MSNTPDIIHPQESPTASSWMNTDGWRIIAARALRTFGYGFTSILLGVTLTAAGFSTLQVGLLLTVALVGDVLAIILVALFLGLSKKVEHEPQRRAPPSPLKGSIPLDKSRAIVFRLASLFALDAFAGGLVVQTILALWFHQRFGVPLSMLGILFFGTNLLAAFSLQVAVWIAQRIGLLNTMVFTHLPSNILLMLVPLMPTFPLAAACLLCRQALSQMDVPTRQAYTMTLVTPEERTAAASFTTVARSVALSVSPLLAGLVLAGRVVRPG